MFGCLLFYVLCVMGFYVRDGKGSGFDSGLSLALYIFVALRLVFIFLMLQHSVSEILNY